MISSVRAEDLFPRFLLRDRDGLAACRAVEAGLNYFLERAQAGLDTLYDVDAMPEWRLDEIAWETGCAYDDTAPIEQKRAWIAQAEQMAAIRGTAEAVRQAAAGIIEGAGVEEWFAYGGLPYHYRLVVNPGDERYEMAAAMAQMAANLRSVMDDPVISGADGVTVRDSITFTEGTVYPICGDIQCE